MGRRKDRGDEGGGKRGRRAGWVVILCPVSECSRIGGVTESHPVKIRLGSVVDSPRVFVHDQISALYCLRRSSLVLPQSASTPAHPAALLHWGTRWLAHRVDCGLGSCGLHLFSMQLQLQAARFLVRWHNNLVPVECAVALSTRDWGLPICPCSYAALCTVRNIGSKQEGMHRSLLVV